MAYPGDQNSRLGFHFVPREGRDDVLGDDRTPTQKIRVVGGHERSNHGGGDDPDDPRRKDSSEKDRHRIEVVDRLHGGIFWEEEELEIGRFGHDKDKRADAPKEGNQEPNHKRDRGPHVLSLDRLDRIHCQGPRHGRRPDRATHQSGRK